MPGSAGQREHQWTHTAISTKRTNLSRRTQRQCNRMRQLNNRLDYALAQIQTKSITNQFVALIKCETNV